MSLESTSKAVARRQRAQVVVKFGLLGQARAGRPGDFQFGGGLDRLPGFLRDHADEILADHHLHHTRHIFDGTFVHADDRRAHRGRTHHASVQHAGQANVVHVFELPGGHGGHVGTADRLAEHGPFARVFALGIPVEREIELPAADQLAVGNLFRCIRASTDDAVRGRELVHRNAEALGRDLEQCFARRRAGEREIAVIEIRGMGLAARGVRLVGRERGVAVDQRHALEGHRQLFGDQLLLRGRNALPEFFLTAVGGDGSVGARWRSRNRAGHLEENRELRNRQTARALRLRKSKNRRSKHPRS